MMSQEVGWLDVVWSPPRGGYSFLGSYNPEVEMFEKGMGISLHGGGRRMRL